VNEAPRYSAYEFERESRYIENLVWDALVVESGQRVLFCGYGEDAKWVKRALEAGADVTVIEHREQIIRTFAHLESKLLRGSTSVIPAQNDAFDLAIAFHYLHETDPFFHAQIVSELARVASRIAIVEPGPPADTLGKRIARLYSQAKRELGQFEYYQPLEYWRKLLQAVKADIQQHVFAFAKIPPREYLRDTIELLLDTMEVEDAPQTDLDELRAIARRSDTMILPPPRYVLTGAAAGDLPQPIFTPREEPTPTPQLARAAQSAEPIPAPPARAVAPPPPAPTLTWSTFTPNAPSPPPPMAAPVPPAFTGLPPIPPPPDGQGVPAPPFGAPFAIPPAGDVPSADTPPFGFGWQWEPPEGDEPPEPR
jgi:hypothetical protein